MISLYARSFSLLLLTLEFYSCQTNQRRDLTFRLSTSSEEIAVFAMENNELAEILPKKISDRVLITESKFDIKSLFSALAVRKSLLSSDEWEPIISDSMAKDMNELVNESILKSPSYAFLILIKKDDPLSPLTKILRTSFLLLKTISGYVLVVPDINQNLTFASQYKFNDWTFYRTPKVLPSNKQELKIRTRDKQLSFFVDHKIESSDYYGRIIILDDEILLPNPLLYKIPSEDDLNSLSINKSVKERLRVLEDLKKSNLINESEFQLKKAEILKDL